MEDRVALLRGINLGKVNRVPMAELRTLAASVGLADVATHLQSGNLVYSSPTTVDEDRGRLSEALTSHFGFEIPVVVVDGARLARVLEEHPFADGDPKRVHIGFSPVALPAGLADELASRARDGERFQVDGDVLFADFAQGVHDSKAAGALARLVAPGFITLRNLSTVRALVARLA